MKRTLFILAGALTLASCGQPATTTTAAPAPKGSVAATADLPLDPYAESVGLTEQGKRPSKPISTTPTTNTGTGPYTITMNFAAGSDQRVIDAMNAAAARWSGIITADVPDVNVSIPAGQCGSNPAWSGTVDDILVFTGSGPIDGPGGTLAQSGPCSVRTSSGLTIYSTLLFDSADVDAYASQLQEIAVHELGHSLGIGSLWNYKGLTTGAGTTDPRYLGAAANREYSAPGGTLGYIPEENTGGSGTAEAHWRERTYGGELMTGYLNSGSNSLSRISIGGLADLGYSVDYTKADSYSTTTLNTLSHEDHLDIATLEQVIKPKFRVN